MIVHLTLNVYLILLLYIKERSQVSIETQTVLAACQGLVFAEDKL